MNNPLFVTFNIFVIYMFPENFFEIRQVAQKTFLFNFNYFR